MNRFFSSDYDHGDIYQSGRTHQNNATEDPVSSPFMDEDAVLERHPDLLQVIEGYSKE